MCGHGRNLGSGDVCDASGVLSGLLHMGAMSYEHSMYSWTDDIFTLFCSVL